MLLKMCNFDFGSPDLNKHRQLIDIKKLDLDLFK